MAFQHEIIVELFRTRPELARELLQLCAGIEIHGGTALRESIDLTQVASTEFRADAVTVIRDPALTAIAAVIVEVQRQEKKVKKLTWPVYVTALRAKLKCPVTLLVVVPDEVLGRWARKPIEIGHPGFCLTPVVVNHADVPQITDPDFAARAPELTVLSALAHHNEQMAPAVASALRRFAPDNRKLYFELIQAAWPLAARNVLRNLMLKPEIRSEIARQAALIEYADGRINTLHEVATRLARAKLGVITSDDERRIVAIEVDAILIELVDALGRAQTVADARAALDRLAPAS